MRGLGGAALITAVLVFAAASSAAPVARGAAQFDAKGNLAFRRTIGTGRI